MCFLTHLPCQAERILIDDQESHMVRSQQARLATLCSRPHGKHPVKMFCYEDLFGVWYHFHLLKRQQGEILCRIPCALRKDHQLGALGSKRDEVSETSGLYCASLSKAHLLVNGTAANVSEMRYTNPRTGICCDLAPPQPNYPEIQKNDRPTKV